VSSRFRESRHRGLKLLRESPDQVIWIWPTRKLMNGAHVQTHYALCTRSGALLDAPATVFVRELTYLRSSPTRMTPQVHLETSTGRKLTVPVPLGTEKRLLVLIADRARRGAAAAP
jgi:hypothetical protein